VVTGKEIFRNVEGLRADGKETGKISMDRHVSIESDDDIARNYLRGVVVVVEIHVCTWHDLIRLIINEQAICESMLKIFRNIFNEEDGNIVLRHLFRIIFRGAL
jgi:hypothetical protein